MVQEGSKRIQYRIETEPSLAIRERTPMPQVTITWTYQLQLSLKKRRKKTLANLQLPCRDGFRENNLRLTSLPPAGFLLVPLVSTFGCQKQGVPLMHCKKHQSWHRAWEREMVSGFSETEEIYIPYRQTIFDLVTPTKVIM